jgi:periplasmic divalent cation tolerance protein
LQQVILLEIINTNGYFKICPKPYWSDNRGVMAEEIIIFVTAASEQEANFIANDLVAGNLIACANVLPGVTSIFRWQNEVCSENEVLMILKSIKTNFDKIITRIKTMHSYEVPEIIAVPIIAGSREYLDWIQHETGKG